jgi:hypothetical protein
MNPTPSLFLTLKLAIVGAAVVGVFVLAALKLIDPAIAIGSVVALVTGLSVALGISSSGAAQASATRDAAATQVTGIPIPPTPGRDATPAETPKAKAAQAGFVRLPVLALLLAAVGLVACGLFGAVEAPIADCTGRVLADAAKGMTVVQIVEDAGGPCALDAAAVMALLLASKDPTVHASKAYGEAARARMTLPGIAP